MSEFDLIPHDYRKQMQLNAAARALLLATGGLLLVLLVLYAVLQASHANLKQQIDDLQLRATQLNADTMQLAERESRYLALNSSREALAALRRGGPPSDLLMRLDAAMLPGTVQLIDLRFERPSSGDDALGTARMSLIGEARSHASISRFVTTLQRQSGFRDIRLLTAELDEDDTRELLRFSITLQVAAGSAGATQ